MKVCYILVRLLFGLLVVNFCVHANEVSLAKPIKVTMRDSGYTLGDLLQMDVVLTLPVDYTIDPQSLPLVGRVTSWMDLKSIAMSQEKQNVYLHLQWQLFGTVEKAQTLKTPSFVLKTQGQQARKVVVPAQSFYYSPVLPMPILNGIERRNDVVAPLMDESTPLLCFSICFVLFVLCGLLWLWLKDRIPWLPYRAGPMNQLQRQLTGISQTFSKQQLRDIHSALNKSAGVSLYPNNLSQLFVNAPYFLFEQAKVEQFFKQSWSVFYCDQPVKKSEIASAPTIQWVKNIALAERLFRRTQ